MITKYRFMLNDYSKMIIHNCLNSNSLNQFKTWSLLLCLHLLSPFDLRYHLHSIRHKQEGVIRL